MIYKNIKFFFRYSTQDEKTPRKQSRYIKYLNIHTQNYILNCEKSIFSISDIQCKI